MIAIDNWIIETTGGYCFSFVPGDGWIDEKNNMEFSTLKDVIENLIEHSGDTIIIREIPTQV